MSLEAISKHSATGAYYANGVLLASGLPITGVLTLADGTVGAPSLAFTSDPDTGAYLVATGTIGLTCGGSLAMEASANLTSIYGEGSVLRLYGTTHAFIGMYHAGTRFAYLGKPGGGSTQFRINTEDNRSLVLASASGTITLEDDLYVPAGNSTTVPNMRFSGSSTTATGLGASSSGASLYVTVSGTLFLTLNGSVGISSAFPFRAPNGSVSAPSYSFGSDTNTGMYRSAADQIGFSCGGAGRFAMTTIDFRPLVDNVYDLGEATLRWNDVRATNGTIVTCDEKEKADIAPLQVGLDFLRQVEPIEHRWLNGRRPHWSFKARQMKSVLDRLGIDSGVYVDPAYRDPHSVAPLGMRTTELIPVLVRAVQELANAVDAMKVG